MTSTSLKALDQGSNVVPLGPNPFREFWDKGYHRLIPIIPPGAPISPHSHLAKRISAGKDPRGKCPGARWPDGTWTGFNWTKCEADERDLLRWAAMGANGGIKTGHGLGAFDVDLLDKEQAKIASEILDRRFGQLPARIGRWPKALYPFRTDADCPYMRITVGPQTALGGDRIEVLNEGKQFVAFGRHPTTMGPYQWKRPLVPLSELPFITKEAIAEALEELRSALPQCSTIERERGLLDEAVNQETLLAPGLSILRAAVAATPNTMQLFATRESYRDWGYAIKASTRETEWAEAFDIWFEWCSRWEGGHNDLEVVKSDWERMKAPFRRGWSWINETAERLSEGKWTRASIWFEPIQEEGSVFGDRVFGDPAEHEKARETSGPLPAIAASEWIGLDPAPQEWLAEGLIPARQVTMLGGDGGNGKSLLALQLAAAKAAGNSWLGFAAAEPMKTLFLTAEDEPDELARRLRAIETFKMDGENSVYNENLLLSSLDGEDAVLASPSRRDGLLATSAVYRRLWLLLEDQRPGLVILDTQADLFGGDENNRIHARQFIGFLRKLIKNFQTTIILLYHPSISGMASTSGTSGNTAWNNSVRSRLYLDRIFSDDKRSREYDPDARVLVVKKSNRSRSGEAMRLRYSHGRFVRDDARVKSATIVERETMADEMFMFKLEKAIAQGREASPLPQSRSYAPRLFVHGTRPDDLSVIEYESALNRLLNAGRVAIVKEGRPSHQKSKLVMATGALFDLD